MRANLEFSYRFSMGFHLLLLLLGLALTADVAAQKKPVQSSEPEETEQVTPAIPIAGPYLERARAASSEPLPDLYVSELSFEPQTPSRSATVHVRVGIYNQGAAEAEAFTVEWWPGENYPAPGCSWRIEGLAANGGRILTCSGYVYPSWYAALDTVVKVDSAVEIAEEDEANNTRVDTIQVTQ